MQQKVKYITNKDLLAEIKVCKASFCAFAAPEYASYDIIVEHEDMITASLLAEVLAEKAGPVAADTVVFRVMTDAHLPPIDDKYKRRRTIEGQLAKTNFTPFRHFIVRDGQLIEVGRSHWLGDFENGGFYVAHGKISDRLARMFMLLVEQYARRGNWRGYCVDAQTEALTQRGWLTGDEINESDMILSYDASDGKMKWSRIKSIYRGDYDGKMFKLDVVGMDALVTPGHKFITSKGLKEVDYLIDKDRVILMGDPVEGGPGTYSNAFVELVGWTVTEGNYYEAPDRNYTRLTVYQNEGPNAARIRNCISTLGGTAGETEKLLETGNINIGFTLSKEICEQIVSVAPGRIMSMPFLLSLTESQRELLIDTMVSADGCRTKLFGENLKYGGYRRFNQKEKPALDAFLALCTMNGHRTSTHHREIVSYGKPTTINVVNIFSRRDRCRASMMENVDLHGGKRNGRSHPGRGKLAHPNQPTFDYKGRVWCPETEYGSFMARRNGTIYLTGNSYNDEMRSHALMQLAQVGLQFDESRSANPFSFYTQIIKNCFRRILNVEKRSSQIRDDMLIMAGAMPSHTRQVENELDQRDQLASPEKAGKRGRKPKNIADERDD
jgi:hypothetical protein